MAETVWFDQFEVEVGSPAHQILVKNGKVPTAPGQTLDEPSADSPLTKKELHAALDGLGVEIPATVKTNAELRKLLDESQPPSDGATLA